MDVSARCLTMLDDTRISFFRKILSMDMGATRVGTAQGHFPVLVESKECMVNLIRDMECLPGHLLTSIRLHRPMQAHSASRTLQHPAETAPLLEDWAVMDVQDPRSLRKIHSTSPIMLGALMGPCLMFSVAPSQVTQARLQDSAARWLIKARMKTRFVAMEIPK